MHTIQDAPVGSNGQPVFPPLFQISTARAFPQGLPRHPTRAPGIGDRKRILVGARKPEGSLVCIAACQDLGTLH
jgi:hypothetical protein